MDPRHSRVAVTGRAASLLLELYLEHGRLMIHQSGGCCDGSAPMCFAEGEFRTGDADIRLGDLDVPGAEPIPMWIGRDQFASWSHTHLTVDVVPGRGAGFSLEAPRGVRFIVLSRLLTAEESEIGRAHV